jgi:alpha-beta hydrolase superfamily lysophospholipase
VPVYGLGESMGGAVVLHALRRHPDGWLDAAVLLAPAVWNRREMPWYQTASLRVLAHTWRGLELSGRATGRTPTDDPEVLRRLRDDPLRIHKTRVDALWGLADLMDSVTAEPLDIRLPLLILYGGNDEIVPREPTCAWLETLASEGSWQLGFYPDAWHLLTRSTAAPTVLADLAAWYGNPGVRLPSGYESEDSLDLACASAGPSGRAAAAVAK